MKTRLIILSMIIFLATFHTMAQDSLKHFDYSRKVEHYRKVQKGAKLSTLIGLSSASVGVVIMVTSFWEHGPPDADFPYTLGAGLFIIGTAGTLRSIKWFWLFSKPSVSLKTNNPLKISGLCIHLAEEEVCEPIPHVLNISVLELVNFCTHQMTHQIFLDCKFLSKDTICMDLIQLNLKNPLQSTRSESVPRVKESYV